MRRRVTVTVEASTAEAAEAAVAAGRAPSVSAWVASAMTEHAHRESLAEVLAEIRSELGPASDEETAWARSVLAGPAICGGSIPAARWSAAEPGAAAGAFPGAPASLPRGMRTLLPDPPPPKFDTLLRALREERRRIGADTHDEVWEGVLHMAPAPRDIHGDVCHQLGVVLDGPARAAGLHPGAEFNLGEPGDYRVPDAGLHRERSFGTYATTAALVVEVVSPSDETWDKLGFYAAHGVGELVIADPQMHTVRWLALQEGAYRDVQRSRLIALGPAELVERIDWPSAG